MKKFWPLFFIIIAVAIFFKPFILEGKLPIPADTIVGLYHPYRDLYAANFPRGITYKNFMITDPVRQQYPWKNLTMDVFKKLQLPLWNPYSFAGTPLLGNFQSAVFYPANLIFLLMPYSYAWSIMILLTPLLSAIFMYLYLFNLNLGKRASLFGSLAFAFGGFSMAWLEWGNVINTALWLPLILFSIDKIVQHKDFNLRKLNNYPIKWLLILFLSLLFSFFAGHLQIFFYIFVLSFCYLIFRAFDLKKTKLLPIFLIPFFVFVIFSAIEWIPFLKFTLLSARNLDQDWHTIQGWFVPWQNLIQFIFPDFFGNPATLNYFGVWNYGEFIGYIGIASVIFSILALFKRNRYTMFFALVFLISLLLALPNVIAKIPYKFSFPFISTSQPTRLIFVADFALSVLSAIGFSFFLEKLDKKKIISVLFLLGIFFVFIWLAILTNMFKLSSENLIVSRQNLILPTALLIVNSSLIMFMLFAYKKLKIYNKLLFFASVLIIIVLFADLLRFGWKYTPFTKQDYLFPNTSVLNYLTKNVGYYRIMSTDSSIFPPNFSMMYKIQTLDGYDPLYLRRYAELAAALERGAPDIHSPFGFNRIITPQTHQSHLIDFLGIKYVLSFEPLDEKRYKFILKEGEISLYKNNKVLPRAFFVQSTKNSGNKQEEIDFLFQNKDDLKDLAIAEGIENKNWARVDIDPIITYYSENKVEIKTENQREGFLVFTDSYYPTWHATIDGKETKIYLTDYNFRGIVVPAGEHKIVFYDTLF